jgi:hypothetical protein
MISCYKEMLHEEKFQAKESVLGAIFNKKADNYLDDEPQLNPSSSI